jgi:RNA polymerase sigma factor (sigma-70 family)
MPATLASLTVDIPPSDQARWFDEEIKPHEPALRAYLKSRFSDVHDVDDLVQESFLRVLEARKHGPIASAKAYLFATARNAALTILRRPHIFSDQAVTDFPALCVMEEGMDVAERASINQEVALLLDAIDSLPNRCREIFILRKLKGVSQKEIAARLGISDQTVQVQVSRGIKKCGDYLRQQGLTRE